MLPILFSDTGATSQDGSHSAIFRMQGPEGCAGITRVPNLTLMYNRVPHLTLFYHNVPYSRFLRLVEYPKNYTNLAKGPLFSKNLPQTVWMISQVSRKGQDSFILKTCKMRWTIVKFGKRGITTICRLGLVWKLASKWVWLLFWTETMSGKRTLTDQYI